MILSTIQLIALKKLPGVGNSTIAKIIDSFNDETVDDANLVSLLKSCNIKKPKAKGGDYFDESDITKALDSAFDVIKLSERDNIQIHSIFDISYPSVFLKLYNESGKQIRSPLVIYSKGDISLLNKASITIIGTRSKLDLINNTAKYFAREFSLRGINIVSGLALGCDSSAHIGAMIPPYGKTTAILASGLDSIYPSLNTSLADKILDKEGLLISEYEVGSKVSNYSLVARDLLQACASKATLVIATGINGGSMHAARSCSLSGKKLYTVCFSDNTNNTLDETAGNIKLVNDLNAIYIKKLTSHTIAPSIDSIVKTLL